MITTAPDATSQPAQAPDSHPVAEEPSRGERGSARVPLALVGVTAWPWRLLPLTGAGVEQRVLTKL